VIPDLRSLLDHEDLERAPGICRELPEADRAGEARWARTDEEDVNF
jgi:hypothetical protein